VIARALLAVSFAILHVAAIAAPELVPGEAVAVMPMPADARAQLNPAVAHDGKGTYLVVWQQGRFYHQSQSADILAIRIDSRGRVLDRQPIVVCSAEASQEKPQVAFSGGTFLVVWHDLRNGRDWDVYAARVSPDGRARERNGFLVAGGARNQASPVLASADGGFLVVWQHHNRHYQLQAARIPAAAGGAPTYPLEIHGEDLWGGDLALTRLGDGWLLRWNNEKGWSKSGGATTMGTWHFVRLTDRNGRLDVLDKKRSPGALGRSGGQFASDGVSTALYAGWGIAGRGNRIATAALFGAEQAAALRNPNPERARGWAGWNTERVITLHDVSVSVDGPVAAAFGQDMYLTVARQAYSGKPNDRNRLLGSRLTSTGVRIDKAPDWPVLHESPHRIGNPTLAAWNRQFLLVFEQEDVTGRRQIWAKILKAE